MSPPAARIPVASPLRAGPDSPGRQKGMPVPRLRPVPSAGILVGAILVVGLAFFLIEHNLYISRMEMYGTTQDELEANAAGGKLTNQVGFTLIGLLGMTLLFWPGGRTWDVANPVAWLILAFLALCFFSSLWSIDPPRTFKRSAIGMLCFLGALGIARTLPARSVCLLIVAVTAGYATAGLLAELALGTFLRPVDGEYRFAGTLHPNGQGANCSLLCLATLCLLTARLGPTQGKGWLWPVLLGGAVLLVLSKSRTSLAALFAGMLVVRLLTPAWNQSTFARSGMALGLALAWLAGAVVLAGLLVGVDALTEGLELLTLGRAEHITTLTGRTELWPELLPYIERRPILGYGYGSFWSDYHIDEVSGEVFWSLSSAHSAYIDIVLSVGVVGGGLLLLVVLCGLFRAAGRYRAAPGAGQALAVALLVYGLVDGVAESDFILPAFPTFLAGCGLCRVAFFQEDEASGLGSRIVEA